MNLNKAILIGRLTRDPEIKSLPSGQSVCNFSIATSRFWSDRETNEKREKTEFHNIVAWGRQAEIVEQYLSKGSLILIEGRIETRSWEDTSGNKRYRTEVIAENIQLGPRNSSSFSKESDKEGVEVPNKDFFPKKQNSQKEEKIPIIDKEEISNEDSDEIDVSKIPF